jgi:hypothetical protein
LGLGLTLTLAWTRVIWWPHQYLQFFAIFEKYFCFVKGPIWETGTTNRTWPRMHSQRIPLWMLSMSRAGKFNMQRKSAAILFYDSYNLNYIIILMLSCSIIFQIGRKFWPCQEGHALTSSIKSQWSCLYKEKTWVQNKSKFITEEFC